jgi:hypothetical protein
LFKKIKDLYNILTSHEKKIHFIHVLFKLSILPGYKGIHLLGFGKPFSPSITAISSWGKGSLCSSIKTFSSYAGILLIYKSLIPLKYKGSPYLYIKVFSL